MGIVRIFISKKNAFVVFCEHHRRVAKMIEPFRNIWHRTGIGLALGNSQPETKKLHEDYMQSDVCHREEIIRFSDMLEDDLSRRTLKRVLEYRQSWDRSVLKDIFVKQEYFLRDIFGPVEDEVFVDGGAYVGDTVEGFVKIFGGGYKRIYAWEPDADNFLTLKKNTKALSNIIYVPCGMWSERTELHFEADGSQCSKIAEDKKKDTISIKADSIDNVCAGDKVTFIKMDIEGSEMAALQGAISVIKRDKPRLAISVYHRPEDLYEIPFWIRQTVPEYKLYLRHHSDEHYDTVLYATL